MVDHVIWRMAVLFVYDAVAERERESSKDLKHGKKRELPTNRNFKVLQYKL